MLAPRRATADSRLAHSSRAEQQRWLALAPASARGHARPLALAPSRPSRDWACYVLVRSPSVLVYRREGRGARVVQRLSPPLSAAGRPLFSSR